MKQLNRLSPKLHIFMCVNDKAAKGIEGNSCGPKINKETYLEVKNWIIKNDLIHKVYITRTFCLGVCNLNGGSIAIYPKGEYYIDVQNSEEIISLIKKELDLK